LATRREERPATIVSSETGAQGGSINLLALIGVQEYGRSVISCDTRGGCGEH